MATTVVLLVLYFGARQLYPGFGTPRVFGNFIADNAFLGVIAVGLTFVILTGGIDLSVGSLLGFTSILVATMVQKGHVHPVVAVSAALALGTAVGCAHGILVQKFKMAPFLVTLAGLFVCRGLGLWTSKESIQIKHPAFEAVSDWSLKLGEAKMPVGSIVFLAVVAIGIFVAKQTRFGRTVMATGGGEQSAVLMGLPVAQAKVGVYAVSGFCSALGGVLFTVYTGSGNAVSGTGLELDAIAAVVIGGTLLSGGYGSVFGSFLGVLILAVIQTAITFQGTLSSWWTKIVIGVLLMFFLLMQKAIERGVKGRA
ncbi:MAG: sugar ABC transporter permease YjfF [Armatimonadetes bacterium]|nr:sugar ABC transporter permease YjfF [Armatimonadota bacterium]